MPRTKIFFSEFHHMDDDVPRSSSTTLKEPTISTSWRNKKEKLKAETFVAEMAGNVVYKEEK